MNSILGVLRDMFFFFALLLSSAFLSHFRIVSTQRLLREFTTPTKRDRRPDRLKQPRELDTNWGPCASRKNVKSFHYAILSRLAKSGCGAVKCRMRKDYYCSWLFGTFHMHALHICACDYAASFAHRAHRRVNGAECFCDACVESAACGRLLN